MANRFFKNYPSYIVTSPFGERIHPVYKTKKYHNGIDLVATKDGKTGQVDDLIAHTGGTVDAEGYDISAGNFINIRVDKNTTMHYFHMKARSTFKKGAKVNKGDVIGRMGATGTVTGAHLHFGIKKNGTWIDPTPYLEADYPVATDDDKNKNEIPDAKPGYKQTITATVTAGVLNVRKGPGTSYAIVSSLKKGDRVEILEHKDVSGTEWGRFDKGWISLDYTTLDIKEEKLVANLTLPVLVRGDKGATVKAMQQLLMGEGYDLEGYGADSSFGGATERTVEKFQKKVNIPATKVVDEATWKALLHI